MSARLLARLVLTFWVSALAVWRPGVAFVVLAGLSIIWALSVVIEGE